MYRHEIRLRQSVSECVAPLSLKKEKKNALSCYPENMVLLFCLIRYSFYTYCHHSIYFLAILTKLILTLISNEAMKLLYSHIFADNGRHLLIHAVMGEKKIVASQLMLQKVVNVN